MNTENQTITDVAFKEVGVEHPGDYLTRVLRESGYAEPEAWKKNIHPETYTTTDIDQQMFLVNRSLALYLSEITTRGDNIVPRMLISERQTYDNWQQIIREGVVAWLNGRFDHIGKKVGPTVMVPNEDGEEAAAPETDVVTLVDTGETVVVSDVTSDPEADQQAVVDTEEQAAAPKTYPRGETPSIVHIDESAYQEKKDA